MKPESPRRRPAARKGAKGAQGGSFWWSAADWQRDRRPWRLALQFGLLAIGWFIAWRAFQAGQSRIALPLIFGVLIANEATLSATHTHATPRTRILTVWMGGLAVVELGLAAGAALIDGFDATPFAFLGLIVQAALDILVRRSLAPVPPVDPDVFS